MAPDERWCWPHLWRVIQQSSANDTGTERRLVAVETRRLGLDTSGIGRASQRSAGKEQYEGGRSSIRARSAR